MADFSTSFDIDVSQFKQEMAAVVKAVDDFRDAEGKLNKDLLAAEGVTVKQAKSLEKLVNEYAAVASSSKSASDKFEKQRQILMKLNLEWAGLSDASKKSLGEIGRFIDSSSTKMNEYSKAVKAAADESKRIGSSGGFKSIADEMGSTSKSLKEISTQSGSSFSKLKGAAIDAVPGLRNVTKFTGMLPTSFKAAGAAVYVFASSIKTNEVAMDNLRTWVSGAASAVGELKRQIGTGNFSISLAIRKFFLGEDEYKSADDLSTFLAYGADFVQELQNELNKINSEKSKLKGRKAAGEDTSKEQAALAEKAGVIFDQAIRHIGVQEEKALKAFNDARNTLAGVDVDEAIKLDDKKEDYWRAKYYKELFDNTGLHGTYERGEYLRQQKQEVDALLKREVFINKLEQKRRDGHILSKGDQETLDQFRQHRDSYYARREILKEIDRNEEAVSALISGKLLEYKKVIADRSAMVAQKEAIQNEIKEGSYTKPSTGGGSGSKNTKPKTLDAIRKEEGEKLAKEIITRAEKGGLEFDMGKLDPYLPEVVAALKKAYDPNSVIAPLIGLTIKAIEPRALQETALREGANPKSPAAIEKMISYFKDELSKVSDEVGRRHLEERIQFYQAYLAENYKGEGSIAKPAQDFSFTSLPSQKIGKYQFSPYQSVSAFQPSSDESLQETVKNLDDVIDIADLATGAISSMDEAWRDCAAAAGLYVDASIQAAGVLQPRGDEWGYESVEDHDRVVEMQIKNLEGLNDTIGTVTNSLVSMGDAWRACAEAADLSDESSIQAVGAFLDSFSAIGDGVMQLVGIQLSALSAKEATALADGTASASGLPFPYNLAAIATVVSTIGSIFATTVKAAAAKKYAYGGIVPGSSYTGDRIPALVNSGELILNQNEQAVVRNLMGNSTRAQELRVVGELQASGKVLKCVLKNQDRFDSRR